MFFHSVELLNQLQSVNRFRGKNGRWEHLEADSWSQGGWSWWEGRTRISLLWNISVASKVFLFLRMEKLLMLQLRFIYQLLTLTMPKMDIWPGWMVWSRWLMMTLLQMLMRTQQNPQTQHSQWFLSWFLVGHSTNFVNELKLSDFKLVLTKNGQNNNIFNLSIMSPCL